MTTSMGPSTFGVVHPPACLLCGIDVLNRIDLGIVTNLRALLKQDRWKLDTGKHILVPATEIEDKEFIRNPILSSCYFRAVVKLPSSRKLHLTGIGSQAMSRQPVTSGREQPFLYYLPRDVSTARVCGHIRPVRKEQLDDKLFIEFLPADPHIQQRYTEVYPAGHIFHYHCWEILGHLIGKESLSKPSICTRIVKAAREHWNVNNLPWHCSYYAIMNSYCHNYRHLSMEERRALFLNPWIIPEVQQEIAFAQEILGKPKSLYFERIPLEILLMIMQSVFPLEYTHSDVQSTKNMLSVFELNLPDSFWKARIMSPVATKQHLFFESHVLTETDANSVDWRILQLGWMGLILDKKFKASGLRNRERIFDYIKKIISIAEKFHKKPLSKCVRYSTVSSGSF